MRYRGHRKSLQIRIYYVRRAESRGRVLLAAAVPWSNHCAYGTVTTSPPFGVRMADNVVRSVVRANGRTEASAKRNMATAGWGEPQFSLYGMPGPSRRIAKPPRDVPLEPPRKKGSSQYQDEGLST